MKLGRILTIILLTSALLLVSGTIYGGTVILTDTTSAFNGRLPLTGQHILEISQRPACTWDVPSLSACYHGGLPMHPEVSLVYHTPGMRRVLVLFELPGR